MMSLRTHIFHIADIHIHAHNYAHIAYAWKQLIVAILAFPDYKTSAVLAIVGDVFDHKMWLQADDITLFNNMMNDLESKEIRTIMMPGNHDYNINQGGADSGETHASDKILALIKNANYKFITHCSLSGIHIIDNFAFFIHSPIDNATPRPGSEHKDFKKIAMVHEPLTNSKTGSGITFQGQRFSAANFAPIFDVTLLGDIHLPQKLAQNVAYSGSFVQKNRGEGIEHGYFLWDLDKNNGRFIEIPQLSVYIKVNASGNAEPVLPQGSPEKPIVARSVQLHYTACTDEWVRKYSSRLQETYKRPIDGAYNKDTLGITEVKQVQAPTISDLENIIVAKTTSDTSILPQQRDRIMTLHHSLFESKTTGGAPPGDWRIRHLSWSNLYCYGEENWLDFDKLENLNSILGPNKTGKSSIIDILILALYNESIRGIKKYALNTSARQGYIKCIISCGSDRYSIERAWIDTNNVVVRLYKNDVNISGSDMPATYTLIENIIGPKRIFINTAIALQHRQFLVDLSSKERYELVCRMIDLDRLRAVEDDNKVEIRVAKKHRAGLGNTTDILATKKQLEHKKAEVESRKLALDACSSRIDIIRARKVLILPDSLIKVPLSCIEISRRIGLIERMGDFNDQLLLTLSRQQYESILGAMNDLNREVEFLTSKISERKKCLSEEPTDIGFAECEAKIASTENIDISALMGEFTKGNNDKAKLMREIDEARAEMNASQSTITAFEKRHWSTLRSSAAVDAEMTELMTREFVVDRSVLDEIPNLKLAIDTNTTELISQQAKLAALDPSVPMLHIGLYLPEILFEIKSTEALLSGFKQSKESISRLEKLTQETIGTRIFRWADSCEDCKHNKEVLNNSSIANESFTAELTRIKQEEAEAKRQLVRLTGAARQRYTDSTKQLALTIKADYNKLNGIIKRRDAAEATKHKQSHLASELNVAKDRESQLGNIDHLRASIVKSKIFITEHSIQLSALNKSLSAIQEHLTTYQSLDKLRAAYSIFVSNNTIRAEIEQYERDLAVMTKKRESNQIELNRLKAIIDRAEIHKAKIAEMEELTNMFEMATLAEDARDEIKALDKELEEKELLHKSLLGEIAHITHDVGMLTNSLVREEEKIIAITAADTKIADLELYDRIINHKTGIPREMMKNVCMRIQNKCNEVFEQIADFRIGVVFDDEVHLNVITGTSVVSAEQSSGYQKFIIDIIMRQVLCSLTTTGCPRILFVDEGFGSADESNFSIICRKVLPLLARNFEKVIVISHINGIHQYTSKNCVIQLVGDKSKLNFGIRDPIAMKLRVLNDHAETVKANEKEKAARKEEDKQKRSVEREQKKIEEQKSIGDRLTSIGDSIFTRVDSKTVKCEACEKIYKDTLNFSAKHLISAAHLKALKLWIKKIDSEFENID